MKRIIAFALCLITLLTLAGCAKYASGYRATGFVHSSAPSSAYMDFISFDGRMVFRMKNPGDRTLKYTAALESGNAAVYYEINGTRTDLFSLSGGSTADAQCALGESGTVYVIVETDGECRNGDIRFTLE